MARHAAIRAENLTKTLGARTVLSGITLDLDEGELVLLTGANGSGKTTLLRCLAGLVRPDRGLVRWFGRSPADPSARQLIGLVAHESHLYAHLTLRENVLLAARLRGVPEPARRADRWLAAVGLERAADRFPREASQGMRRRASLARALVHDPPILLLDEPFSGLDGAGHDWLRDLLRTRREHGQSTCLTAHDLRAAYPLADRVLELRSGHLRSPARGEVAA
jgi:heme exporter protein A